MNAATKDAKSDFKVSVIIPTHRQTPIGLSSFRAQDCEVEVLVLANGPALKNANIEGDLVHAMTWEGHGATRQAGVVLATGDYVLFSVDDAMPQGESCVRNLVEALEAGDFDAVTGRQLPWPHSDRLTKERLTQWTPAGTKVVEWHQVDHVFALYKRQTLLENPLPNVPIAEDRHWSQGKRIGYVPTAQVIHAHQRTPRSLFRRTRALHVEHCRMGEAPRVPDFKTFLQALPGALAKGARHGPKELLNQIAELLGQWRGAEQARRSNA